MQKLKNFPKQCAALRILLLSQPHFLALLPCWELRENLTSLEPSLYFNLLFLVFDLKYELLSRCMKENSFDSNMVLYFICCHFFKV